MDARGKFEEHERCVRVAEAQPRATPVSWRACLNKYFVHTGLIGLI